MTESEKLKIIKNLENYISENLVKENLFEKISNAIFEFESGRIKAKSDFFEANFEEDSHKAKYENLSEDESSEFDECDFEKSEKLHKSLRVSVEQSNIFNSSVGAKSLAFKRVEPLRNSSKLSLLDKVKNLFSNTELTFQERLFEIIRERNIDEVELYTKAQITKQTFSKIRSNRDYKPTKNTAFLLVLALNLKLEEAENLLSRAGIAFSPSDKFDLAIKFFIENKIYDIFEINEILMQSGIKTLAG